MKVDLVIYDRNGQIALIVEIKRKIGCSAEWAAKWRRNILAHGDMPDIKFFMIALPDRFYLWKNADNIPEPVAPTFEIDAEPLLAPYLEKSGLLSKNISGQGFELIVSAWLNSVLYPRKPLESKDDALSWITVSGLLEAVKGGHLKHEVTL